MHGHPDPKAPFVRGEVIRATTFRPVNDDTVHRVTTAKTPLSEEQKSRTKRYLVSMTIRTVCFLGAVLSHVLGGPPWLTWSLVVGAVILPYVAVVMVNAGRENDPFTMAGAEAQSDPAPGTISLDPPESTPSVPPES